MRRILEIPLPKFARIIFITLIISIGVTSLVAEVATAASVSTTIESNTLPALGTAQFIGIAPRHRVLRLVVGLRLRNRPALDALLVDLYNSVSVNYRHFLTPAQFAEQFAPNRRRYAQVAQFLRGSGLQVVGTYRHRMAIEVSGTVEQVERTFNVSINSYTVNGRAFVANDRDPQVPMELADVIGSVAGLEDYVELQRAFTRGAVHRGEQYKRAHTDWLHPAANRFGL